MFHMFYIFQFFSYIMAPLNLFFQSKDFWNIDIFVIIHWDKLSLNVVSCQTANRTSKESKLKGS